MKFIAPALYVLLSLAACTAPDGEPLITKPGCGLIGCGGVGSYSEYLEATGANNQNGTGHNRQGPVTYRRSGNMIYGSDGTVCRQSNGNANTIYCY